MHQKTTVTVKLTQIEYNCVDAALRSPSINSQIVRERTLCGNSSIDTRLIRDIYCGPEVLFETCVPMKFVDDDDDDDVYRSVAYTFRELFQFLINWHCR